MSASSHYYINGGYSIIDISPSRENRDGEILLRNGDLVLFSWFESDVCPECEKVISDGPAKFEDEHPEFKDHDVFVGCRDQSACIHPICISLTKVDEAAVSLAIQFEGELKSVARWVECSRHHPDALLPSDISEAVAMLRQNDRPVKEDKELVKIVLSMKGLQVSEEDFAFGVCY